MNKELISICKLCRRAGILLKLNEECIGTALIYIHKYKRLKENQSFSDKLLITSCLFLASKVFF